MTTRHLAPALALLLAACTAAPAPVDVPVTNDVAAFDAPADAIDVSDAEAPEDAAPDALPDALPDAASTDAVDATPPTDAVATLSEAQFARAREIYFNRCAGCHGTLRAGATGPALTPERMIARGTNFLRSIISSGTDRGMPGWVRTGLMTREEAELLALYVQLPAPTPPQRPLADIRASWQLRTPVAERPTAPPAGRAWENYFGVGLVKTTENLGAQGDQPSNQALLDWLATELIRLKWDLKAFQKTIVMSATYRQSSQVTPELMERDPENRLLARGARFRVTLPAYRSA